MRIAICDDRQDVLAHADSLISSLEPHCETSQFSDILSLFQEMKGGAEFDAVFMDIEWEGEQKGIDFAEQIYSLSPKTQIIFITGYPERYSQQIFLQSTNLKGFIAKPPDPDIMRKHLERIKHELTAQERGKLVLKYNGIVSAVDPDDIVYIESRAHTATIHSMDGEYLCYEKLNTLAKRLPGQFILTHKSYLANMDKIRRIERESVILEKQMEIPVSKSRQTEVRESYFRYIGSTI